MVTSPWTSVGKLEPGERWTFTSANSWTVDEAVVVDVSSPGEPRRMTFEPGTTYWGPLSFVVVGPVAE